MLVSFFHRQDFLQFRAQGIFRCAGIGHAGHGDFKGTLAGVAQAGQHRREAVAASQRHGSMNLCAGAVIPQTVENINWPRGKQLIMSCANSTIFNLLFQPSFD